MASVTRAARSTTAPAERTVSTTRLKSLLTTFERALRRSTTGRGVDLRSLERELRSGRPGKEASAVFQRLVGTLETRFAKQVQVSAGCGGTAWSREPADALTPRQVAAVLGAVLEARTRGVARLDRNKDGKVSTREAKRDVGSDLAAQLSELAARVSTEAKKTPRPVIHPRPSPVRVGC